MDNTDKKKYNKMENVLQYINKHFVTVANEDSKSANPILKFVIEEIIEAMKDVNPLFKNLYESVLFGGSFFDNLKVGKPEEFDIDLKLVFPKLLKVQLLLSNQPGFVTVQFINWDTFEKSNEFEKFKDLAKFKDDKNYLLVSKILQWWQSTVNLALNKLGAKSSKLLLLYNGKNIEITTSQSGPAMTLKLSYNNIKMDVDLVAVFKFTKENWPPSPFKSFNNLPQICQEKQDFLIVPKTPKVHVDVKDRCWRLSFQEQERVLINGNNCCKPALRLIKKLRDTQNHSLISSYFIKTVFLHEIDKQDKQFWNNSLSFIFMHMLQTYQNCLSQGKIPYYWNKNNNLLQSIDGKVIDNFKNFLIRIINDVDRKINEDPFIIAKFLLTSSELSTLKNAFNGDSTFLEPSVTPVASLNTNSCTLF